MTVIGAIYFGHQRKDHVNRRIFYSMRRIGNGYAGMKRFLVLLNHPSPMTEKNSSAYRNSVKEVVMQNAALETYNKKDDADWDDNIVDIGISGRNVDLLPWCGGRHIYRNCPYFGCGSDDTLLSGVYQY